MVVVAEIQHHEAAVRIHGLRAEKKAELEEEARKRKLEAERAERERLKRLEQARIDRLLKDAAALKQATDIRNYVEAARQAASERGGVSDDTLNRWRNGALAQADRIDPICSISFRESLDDTSIKVERAQDERDRQRLKVQVLYGKEVATPPVPESCVGRCEGAREALTGNT